MNTFQLIDHIVLVRVLDPSLLKIAPLAYECQLWSIRVNSARYPLNNWPIQALNLVCSLILERQMELEIKAVARNVIKCDLLLDLPSARSSNQEICRTTLRQTLINRGFAETANEEHVFQVKYLRHIHLHLHFDQLIFSMIIVFVVMHNDFFVIQMKIPLNQREVLHPKKFFIFPMNFVKLMIEKKLDKPSH